MKRLTLESVCRKIACRPATDLRADVPCDPSRIWREEFFGLHRTRYWLSANAASRETLVMRCASNVLREALGIEREAMDYCAKRVLAAEDAVEKKVYCLMAAEEARHYHWLDSLVSPLTTDLSPDAFALFLKRLVAEGTPLAQSYLLQIILEGWGFHYRRLGAGSRDPSLPASCSGIARDEGLHYAAGAAHFDALLLTGNERDFIRGRWPNWAPCVACGPLSACAKPKFARRIWKVRANADAGELARGRFAVRTSRTLGLIRRPQGHGGEADWLRSKGLLTPLPIRGEPSAL